MHARLDPIKNIFEAFDVDTGDGERLAAAVVHKFVTNTVAEDHGNLARESAFNQLRSRVSVCLVEDGDERGRFLQTKISNGVSQK